MSDIYFGKCFFFPKSGPSLKITKFHGLHDLKMNRINPWLWPISCSTTCTVHITKTTSLGKRFWNHFGQRKICYFYNPDPSITSDVNNSYIAELTLSISKFDYFPKFQIVDSVQKSARHFQIGRVVACYKFNALLIM